MYPKHYLDYFRNFDRTNTLFVAMPFRDEFAERWAAVYEPAARRIGLNAVRVDKTIVSDSILTDIIDGIAHARMILVDLSASNDDGSPNGNVMYELGLAHASRLPDEVVIIRSGSQRLLFDVRHIRVHTFDPTDLEQAEDYVTKLLQNGLNEIDTTKDLLVKRTLYTIDSDCYSVIWMQSVHEHSHGAEQMIGTFPLPLDQAPFRQFATPIGDGTHGFISHADARRAMARLQELGIIRPIAFLPVGGTMHFDWTDFGRAVKKALMSPGSTT